MLQERPKEIAKKKKKIKKLKKKRKKKVTAVPLNPFSCPQMWELDSLTSGRIS